MDTNIIQTEKFCNTFPVDHPSQGTSSNGSRQKESAASYGWFDKLKKCVGSEII